MVPYLAGEKIADLLREGRQYLLSSHVEEPSLTCELLLARTLGLSRTELHCRSGELVGDDERSAFQKCLERRNAGEPVQYITGGVDWLHFGLLVESGVFIPRPETEVLVEAVVGWLETRGRRDEALAIWDIGTGSGNIAVAVAKAFRKATVYASDISLEALRLARKNCRRNGVNERVHFLQGDLLGPFREARRADLIISNPPYVSTSELNGLQREVRDYEPRSSLDGGRHGLELIGRLLRDSLSHLNRGGVLALEVGSGQSGDVLRIATSNGLFGRCSVVKDLEGVDRVVIMEL